MNPPSQEERPYHGSLLDPRTHGWVLEQSWPGLFDLYTRDGEACAELSPELNAIEAALLQGYSVRDKAAASIKSALFLAAVICQGINEGVDGSFGFQDLRKQVADLIASEFGRIFIEIWSAKTRHEAALKAQGAVNLMRRAMAAVVHKKFPSGGRGNRSYPPKAVLAIWLARGFCEHHRRLPTKRESADGARGYRGRLREVKGPRGQVGETVHKGRFGGTSRIICKDIFGPRSL